MMGLVSAGAGKAD